jgi:hypothetical protein
VVPHEQGGLGLNIAVGKLLVARPKLGQPHLREHLCANLVSYIRSNASRK